MNKNAIQKYAVWARNELIEQIKQRAYQYGISDKGYGDENAAVIAGRVLSPDERRQRKDFIAKIREHGYEQVVEEVTYTWFNRFVALRFMEVNDYLPTHVRVFSDANDEFNPEILKDVLHLNFPGLDRAKVSELLNANATDELYRYLLLTQCNALNEALPEMFEKLGSYTEMLLPNNILKPDGVLGRLVTDIPEEAWHDAVQIIGWLYQYYNTEPKQAVFDGLKKNIKITKEKIPAATQLFTPDWIVRYMVENSLGRLWLEYCPPGMAHGNAQDALRELWTYYIEEAEQDDEAEKKLNAVRSSFTFKSPEEIKIIDPCMGSGHILVYAFDILMQIYFSEGYSEREAAKLILEKNLYGLDIDRRAYQLAYFALMMKARQYNRRIFSENVKPQVYHPEGWSDGEEYGSLLKIDNSGLEPSQVLSDNRTYNPSYAEEMRMWNFKCLLSQKYDVVVTNPPYMGSSGMGGKLSQYVKDYYPDSKSDLFAAFIEKCGELLKPRGYQAMVTQHAWMFLSSYEKLRVKLMHRDIVNMAHLGARAFEEIGGEVVQTTAFVLSKRNIAGFKGTYVRLVDYNSQQAKEVAFLSESDRHTAKKENFEKIPGCPVAYWVSAALAKSYEIGKPITEYVDTFQGIITGDNDKFLRQWFEVEAHRIAFHKQNMNDIDLSEQYWIPYNKGGAFRKWYGIQDNVVYWKFGPDDKTRGKKGFSEYYLREYVAWSYTVSSSIATRFYPCGFLWDVRGSGIMDKTGNLFYLQSLISSKVGYELFRVKSDVLSCQVENITDFPIIIDEERHEGIEDLTKECVTLSRTDWDAFETSWDFKKHPLVGGEE